MKLTSKVVRQNRRIAVFVFAVVAALITESTDAVSMVLVWLPMCALYEIAAWLLAVWEARVSKTR